MDDLEDIRVTVYIELNKIRKEEVYYLNKKLLEKYSIVDIESIVDKSILTASYTYDENNTASWMTYYKKILRNSTINYIRDNGKYDFTSIDEIFENDKGDKSIDYKIEDESLNRDTDALLEKEKNQDLEELRKQFLKFINEDLEGIEKTVFEELYKIVSGRGDINFQEIAKDYKIDKKRIYKIKEKMERKFLAFIKKLPEDIRKIFRKITFEPIPGEPTKFAYLTDTMQVEAYKDNKEISTFEKLVSLLFAYQNNKFNNFINNNISDEQFKLIYNQLR